MDSNQNNSSINIKMVPRFLEDEYDSNSNAANTSSNPQNYIPQEYNNPDFQQNYIPQDSNNLDFLPQDTPYNFTQAQTINPAQSNTTISVSPTWAKPTIILMSIFQFLFVIKEIIVLNCKCWKGIAYVHIDEVLVLGLSILFFLSFFEKFNIDPVIRTLVTSLIWFIGTLLRVFSFSSDRLILYLH